MWKAPDRVAMVSFWVAKELEAVERYKENLVAMVPGLLVAVAEVGCWEGDATDTQTTAVEQILVGEEGDGESLGCMEQPVEFEVVVVLVVAVPVI